MQGIRRHSDKYDDYGIDGRLSTAAPLTAKVPVVDMRKLIEFLAESGVEGKAKRDAWITSWECLLSQGSYVSDGYTIWFDDAKGLVCTSAKDGYEEYTPLHTFDLLSRFVSDGRRNPLREPVIGDVFQVRESSARLEVLDSHGNSVIVCSRGLASRDGEIKVMNLGVWCRLREIGYFSHITESHRIYDFTVGTTITHALGSVGLSALLDCNLAIQVSPRLSTTGLSAIGDFAVYQVNDDDASREALYHTPISAYSVTWVNPIDGERVTCFFRPRIDSL